MTTLDHLKTPVPVKKYWPLVLLVYVACLVTAIILVVSGPLVVDWVKLRNITIGWFGGLSFCILAQWLITYIRLVMKENERNSSSSRNSR